jgi:putative nicotinate phosphoribosyltransferase
MRTKRDVVGTRSIGNGRSSTGGRLSVTNVFRIGRLDSRSRAFPTKNPCVAATRTLGRNLLNLIHFQMLVASKAARVVLAAHGKQVIDFGLRRAHGLEAALLAARACYLAGFDGTSNVLAEARFGVPVFGTMAHSFVQAHEDEALAFERFAAVHPDNVVLLLDTGCCTEGR